MKSSRPRDPFFMSLRDLSFWLKSAKTDMNLARLRAEHSDEHAFDQIYAQSGDPWGYLTPHFRYQRLKYEKMLRLLPEKRFLSVLDVGCGNGTLARMIAPHADSVTGMELSSVAVTRAQELSTSQPHLQFQQQNLLELIAIPSLVKYDLVILADVLYYLPDLTDELLLAIIHWAQESLTPDGGILLANHYFFNLDPQSRIVRNIHDRFHDKTGLTLCVERRHPFFLTSYLERTP